MYQYWPSEEGIGSEQVKYLDRDDDKLGIPPVESIKIMPSTGCAKTVTEENFLSGTITTGSMSMISDLFTCEVRRDWNDVRVKVQKWYFEYLGDNQELTHSPFDNAIKYMDETDFNKVKYSGQNFPLLFQYRLPGTNEYTSSFTKTFVAH